MSEPEPEPGIFERDGYMKRWYLDTIVGPDGRTTPDHRAEMASIIRSMIRHNNKGQLFWASFYAGGDP